MVDKQRIDYHPDSGSGSAEDKYMDEQKPREERAEGDSGETTFDPQEAPPSKRKRFEHLRKRHHEHYSMDGNREINDTNVAYDTKTVCSRLEMTDAQAERTLLLVDENRVQGRKYEITILAVATHVLNEDGRWIQRSTDDTEYGDPMHDEWVSLCEAYDVDKQTVKHVRADLATELSLEGEPSDEQSVDA